MCVLKSHPEYRYWPRVYRNSCSPLDGGCCCQNYLASLVIRITSEWPTIQDLSKQNISNDLLTREFRHERRETLFRDRHFALQFIGEVFEEDHVVLWLLPFRCLDWHDRARTRHERRQSTTTLCHTSQFPVIFWKLAGSLGRNMLNRTVVLATLLAGAAACVHAQWLNYPDPRTPRTRDGKPNLTAPAPRVRDGKPDLSGVWEPKPTPASEITRALGDDFFDLQVDLVDGSKYTLNLFWDLKPEEVPLRPEAAALLKQHVGTSAPTVNCLPGGIPFAMLVTPFKIVQAPREIVMLFEHPDPPRQIHTDGRPLPKDPEPSWLGSSTGTWQGQTLVVETIGFNGKNWLDGFGHPLSESMHLTERYHRRDFGHMDIEMTFDDPKYYTRPFTVKLPMRLIPDSSDVFEDVCAENEKDRVHLDRH